MKKSTVRPFWLVLLVGMLLTVGAYADPPGRVGRLSYISGPVSFSPAGLDNEWSEAIVNRPITTGDHLWTDQRGIAEVQIASTALRMAEGTAVDVLNIDDNNIQLRLAQGSINIRVRRVPDNGVFEIDTPTAALTIRVPGSYRVDVDRNGGARTSIISRAGMISAASANAAFDLPGGRTATLVADQPTYDMAPAPPEDDFDHFCALRDQRDDRVMSARYVSNDMTGYEDLDRYGTWRNDPVYGNVWVPSNVAAGWAPYRDGRWMWVEPWGWTWVDQAPWGFAPFHYGRWAYIQGGWGWCPGVIAARPVYAPALVAFVGGSGFGASVSIGGGGPVGWFPLGFHEAYVPWYHVSPTYIRSVNVAHVTNITNVTNITQVNYVNRGHVTAVSAMTFARSGPVLGSSLPPEELERMRGAPIIHGVAPMAPGRESLLARPANFRPPEAVRGRQVFGVRAPPAGVAPFAERQAEFAREQGRPMEVRPLTQQGRPEGHVVTLQGPGRGPGPEIRQAAPNPQFSGERPMREAEQPGHFHGDSHQGQIVNAPPVVQQPQPQERPLHNGGQVPFSPNPGERPMREAEQAGHFHGDSHQGQIVNAPPVVQQPQPQERPLHNGGQVPFSPNPQGGPNVGGERPLHSVPANQAAAINPATPPAHHEQPIREARPAGRDERPAEQHDRGRDHENDRDHDHGGGDHDDHRH